MGVYEENIIPIMQAFALFREYGADEFLLKHYDLLRFILATLSVN